MKVGDLVRWTKKSFGTLYPEDLGVILEVTGRHRDLVRIFWIQTNRDFAGSNPKNFEWPLNCLELVEE